MANVKVYSFENKEVGELELADKVFKAPVNRHLMWEAVNHFLAVRRDGTASTKVRSEVAGSGAKMWKQKGTGRARVGDGQTPKWRGGGTVHGPKPRSYAYPFPKKKRRGAIRSALSLKLNEGSLKIIDSFGLESHKTRHFIEQLNNLGLNKKVLLVGTRDDSNLVAASRNIPSVKFTPSLSINIHDLLKYDNVLISEAAVKEIQEVLSK
ncbi:MAG: 50S ribosomal protein L4 [Acidobacteria bacterium]|nr:MAG: 50S ribosomal protein L4 [Acidobacteriota bacterium]PIE89981.1 MAG: 50S ribosomal protein L4 [Acidobacteriota bacterium]